MMNLDDYIQEHISPEHPYLYRLYRATNTQLLRPRMASGHQQGLLLRMFCQMLRTIYTAVLTSGATKAKHQ